MTEVAWTAIGLLAATLFGMLFFIGARIDGLGGRIDSLGARIDSLGARIDSLGARIDSLGARLDARIDALAVQMSAHLERHAG
jgi:hypothetical protein